MQRGKAKIRPFWDSNCSENHAKKASTSTSGTPRPSAAPQPALSPATQAVALIPGSCQPASTTNAAAAASTPLRTSVRQPIGADCN